MRRLYVGPGIIFPSPCSNIDRLLAADFMRLWMLATECEITKSWMTPATNAPSQAANKIIFWNGTIESRMLITSLFIDAKMQARSETKFNVWNARRFHAGQRLALVLRSLFSLSQNTRPWMLMGIIGFTMLPGCPTSTPCESLADCPAGMICEDGFCAESGGSNNVVVQDGIGPEGGTLEGPGGEIFIFPEGALNSRFVFSFEYLSSSIVVPGLNTVSRIYNIQPEVSLLVPAEIRVPATGLGCEDGCYIQIGDDDLSEWVPSSETAAIPSENLLAFSDVTKTGYLVVDAVSAPAANDAGTQVDSGEGSDSGTIDDSGVSFPDAGAWDGGSADDSGIIVTDGSVPDVDGGVVDDAGFGPLDGGPVDPGPCMTDLECSPEVCDVVNGLCVGCVDSEDCAMGQLCNMGTNSCYTGCMDNDDCLPTEECDLFFGQCVSVTPPDCQIDDDCSTGEYCNMETQECTPIIGCIDDDGCMLFEECNLATNECESTIENPCEMDDDCDTGFYCDQGLGGSCEQIGPCVADDDCAGVNEYCHQTSFTCEIELECVSHGECDFREICNFATNECFEEPCSPSTPGVCPVGLICDYLIERCQLEATCWDLFDCTQVGNQICDPIGGSVFYDLPCGPDPDDFEDGGVFDGGSTEDLYVCEDPRDYCLETLENGQPTGEFYCHAPGYCMENSE
jgi:hypothetical protein